MLVSVIICTYRRADDLGKLLACLDRQTYRPFEVLIVDGSGEDMSVREVCAAWIARNGDAMDLRVIGSAKGLTRQRNVGLEHARGDVVCFLDDDVTFGETFLSRAVDLLDDSAMADVGGIGGYDMRNYPTPMRLHFRMKRWLGVVPSLVPGDVDRLGRNVPLAFFEPFSGCSDVGRLAGFCMIYRREAIHGLYFDEELPTYGGEDRDFSMQVARRWRLVVCGDLHLEHHFSPVDRISHLERSIQTGFGAGRTFAKCFQRKTDYLVVARYVIGQFILDTLAFARHPSWDFFRTPTKRAGAIIGGFHSIGRSTAKPVATRVSRRNREGGLAGLVDRGWRFVRTRSWRAAKWVRHAVAPSKRPATPLFVVGCQRSGTNMLVRLLDTSPDTWVYNEDHARGFDNYRIRPRDARLRLIGKCRCRWVVFKPLCDSQNTGRLLSDHPDGVALWVYRDYRDVANSALEHWGTQHQLSLIRRAATEPDWEHWLVEGMSVERRDLVRELAHGEMSCHTAAALKWYLRNAIYFDLALDRRPKTVRLVKYEQLVSRPVEVGASLFALLDIPFKPSYVAKVHATSVGKDEFPFIDGRVEQLCERLAVRLDEVVEKQVRGEGRGVRVEG